MFYNFKQIPVSVNSQNFIVNDIQLSNEITTSPKSTIDSRTSDKEVADSMWVGQLKVNYYLTGMDYLKQYIYSNELQPISGNIGGLMFNQGYLSNYSLSIIPNNPILVNATISFYDQLTGNFQISNPANSTGIILRTSDIKINNLSNYTINPLNIFNKASFTYECIIEPSYNYYDTGITPIKADNIAINQRTITTEIISDNAAFNLPISGENFGVIFNFSNPYNTGIYEMFGCSGLITSKQFNINTDNPHSHTIKIVQHNVNGVQGLSGVIVTSNQIIINSAIGSNPFLSRDGTLNYVERLYIGNYQVTGFSVNRFQSYDQIILPIPPNITNGSLLVQTSYGTYNWPTSLQFSYPAITITGVSQYTGSAGTPIYLSGTNFYNITDVIFGGVEANFQVINPQTILTTIPYNGISSPIVVASNPRNISGFSPSGFFYQPTITSVNPATGLWNTQITISGTNLTGITGIYFNNISSQSFNIINQNTVNIITPQTGKGFASGYIGVYSTGGYGQSLTAYNPVVPIYSFYPTSGQPGTGVVIYTKIDKDYMYPISGGYQIRIGGEITQFYISGGNSTGILTGIIPSNVNTDYIYIYGPDGNLTYPSNTQLDIIGFPIIEYVSPIQINKFQYFNMLMVGKNLEFFTNQPYYISFSGGVSGDIQKYSTGSFINSLNGQSLLLNNIIITGNTGYYNIFLQNNVSGYTLNSGLLVLPPINQDSLCGAVFGTITDFPPNDPNNFYSIIEPYRDELILNSPLYCLGSSNNLFSIIPQCSNAPYQGYITIYPLNNYLNINIIQFNVLTGAIASSGLPIGGEYLINGHNIPFFTTYSGSFSIFQGSNNAIFSGSGFLSGYTYTPTGQLTGITSINIYTDYLVNQPNPMPMQINIF